MTADEIGDDEFVLRHIPGDADHLAEGPRATSINFHLRPGEAGISVSRQRHTTPDELLAQIGDPAAGSRVAGANVGALRALGFVVVLRPRYAGELSHAEIEPGANSLDRQSGRRKLAKLFTVV